MLVHSPPAQICGKCGETHTRKHFWCRACNREYDRARKHTVNAKKREQAKTPKARLKQLLSVNTLDRSLLDFDTLWERLELGGFRCEITGAEFSYEPRNPRAMSIDKIDPNKSYSYDNIRFVCLWLNVAMSNWGLSTLEELINDWKNSSTRV